MKSVAYGTFVIALMAIVSSLFFVIRKKSTGPKWIGPEPMPIQVTGHSSIADDPLPFKWSDLKYAFDIKKDNRDLLISVAWGSGLVGRPHRESSSRRAGGLLHMKASVGALLTSMIILNGCVGPGPFESPKMVEYLDGNYRTLASCAHQQLGRQYGQLRMTDLRERRTVTISPPQAQWDVSFTDDDGGRQTRLEVTSANGTLPGEHALALARACAA